MSELADVLDRLLDADELGSLVGRPARAASVRAKPGALLVLGLADPATGRPTGWARVLWPAASDKAAKTAERARRRGLEVVERSLPGGLVLQSGGIGTDPGLANPLRAARPKRLRELVDRPEAVLRYNPLRRVLVRDRDAVVRVAADTDPVPGALVRRLGSLGLPVPAVLDDGTQPHVTARRFFGDTDLAHTPSAAGIRWAGETLARLHSTTGDVLADDDLAATLGRRTPPTTMPTAVLRHLDPGLADRLDALAARVADRRLDGPSVLLHGDASADQVLVDTATGVRQLNDFDRSSLGPAAVDLGSWLAVDRLAGVGASGPLLAGYAAAGGLVPDDDELTTGIARGLLLRATAPARLGEPDWRGRITARLDDLEEVLA